MTSKSFVAAPVWLVGFRPFFIIACISGAILPLLWVLVYTGVYEFPILIFKPYISAFHWHMHEMFFGFGWALLGGFLLTASKNWVGIRGRHGLTLVILVTLWIIDRITMAYGGDWSLGIVYGLSFPFIAMIVLVLEIDLIKNHAKDSYKDNLYFVLALPLFIVSKLALLSKGVDPALGVSMTLGLFRLCFLIMLERTVEAFMKGAFGVSLRRNRWVDHAIKSMCFLLIFANNMSENLQAVLCTMVAGLMLIRWFYWHPFKALRRIDIGVMYLGYLAIVINLALQGIAPLFGYWGGSVGIHVFTLGAIGLVAPAMIIRISRGHTGRKIAFAKMDKLSIYLMLFALIFRVFVPLYNPGLYTECLYLSAVCWLGAFTLVGYRYIPILLRPRIDGKIV